MTETSTYIDTLTWKERSNEEAGQALVEYGLVLAIVTLTALGLTPVGQWVAARLAEVTAAF
jgi:Flp pilus assembly pilin Flp